MANVAWHDVAPVSELASGELRAFSVQDLRVCVGRTDDTFFALADTCPHAGGSLSDGMLDGKWVICPLHAFAFDRTTGDCPDDPRCAVAAYRTRVENHHLQVCLEPLESGT